MASLQYCMLCDVAVGAGEYAWTQHKATDIHTQQVTSGTSCLRSCTDRSCCLPVLEGNCWSLRYCLKHCACTDRSTAPALHADTDSALTRLAFWCLQSYTRQHPAGDLIWAYTGPIGICFAAAVESKAIRGEPV